MGHFRVRDLSTRVKSHMNYKIMEDFTRVKSPMKNHVRFYIIKCISLFTFYRFQAIKCARRQPSTFYGIEIGKK